MEPSHGSKNEWGGKYWNLVLYSCSCNTQAQWPRPWLLAGHDVNDYEIGKRFGLETINIMNDDGTLNGNAGAYAGLDRFAARKQLWEDMKASRLPQPPPTPGACPPEPQSQWLGFF